MISLVIFTFLGLISSSISEDCSTWPPGLKTIEECCNIPNLIDTIVLNNCSHHCQNSSCNAKCYADSTNLIENGKLNKAALFLETHHYGPESVWDEIIQKSFDKCEDSFDSKNELEEKLIELFKCVKREASRKCPQYQGIMGCSRVEKYVEDCQHDSEDCSKWPKRFDINTVIACCNIPDLVSHAERRDCQTDCMFSTNTFNCTEICAMRMEKFVKDGKLDVIEVKKALNENRNQSMPWEKVIDDAVEGCVKILKDSYKIEVFNSVNSLEAFSFCLNEQLAANCVEFNDIGMATGCYGYIKYKKACPESKPSQRF